MKIVVNPSRIRQFGAPEGAMFCLVVDPELRDEVAFGEAFGYEKCVVVSYGDGDDFERLLLERIPQHSHVLVMSPGAFFQSPPADALGHDRKLLAMACNSTPASRDSIRHFLSVIERTDPLEQERFAERFFSQLELSESLDLFDEKRGTHATLEHLASQLEWNQQAGTIAWGEQQIAPSGEISVLPINILQFDAQRRLPLSGTLALCGYPILHSGAPSFLRADQARIFVALDAIQHSAVVVDVEEGAIVNVAAETDQASSAVDMLEHLFAVDSRYRIIWELGFAINTQLELLAGNHAMNEVYGGSNGALHVGLGLTPFTQYHLDIICPDTVVVGSSGEVVLGSRRQLVSAS